MFLDKIVPYFAAFFKIFRTKKERKSPLRNKNDKYFNIKTIFEDLRLPNYYPILAVLRTPYQWC